MRRLALWVAIATLSVATPVLAQSSGIAGIVRDASGGVLPGVTVEAASPALIERARGAHGVADEALRVVHEGARSGAEDLGDGLGFDDVARLETG